LFLAWRFGNEDPWALYNSVPTDSDRAPRWPARRRAFIYACGLYAAEVMREQTRAMVGGQQQRRAGA
jgi:hypothetical protein